MSEHSVLEISQLAMVPEASQGVITNIVHFAGVVPFTAAVSSSAATAEMIQRSTHICACHGPMGPSRHTHTKRTDSEASEAAVSSLVASLPMVEAKCAK